MTAFPSSDYATPASRLINDLSQHLKRPSHRIHSFLRFQEDLFLDLIDVQLLVADLENTHRRFLTEEEANRLETIGDLQRAFSPQAA